MKVLYISTIVSQKALNEAMKRDPKFNGHAIQKFTRLINKGLVCNDVEVHVLSTFHLPNIGYYYFRRPETEDGVHFHYIPSLNLRSVRIVWLILYCFLKVFLWGLHNRKEKAVICDVLNVSACIGALAASRLTAIRCIGLMTDMPGLGLGNNNITVGHKKKLSLASRINRKYLNQFTHYVFITEHMNKAINTKHRPYIVMEGLVDTDMRTLHSSTHKKNDKRIVLYAGGIHERYGLKMLIEGFMQANIINTELWIYGSGPLVQDLQSYSNRDSRIRYMGIRPNDEVVTAELNATILVNPRPTHEEFTKYSFPSKNLEYMASGTPVLTTKLPGMPKEYYPFVYLFNKGETTEGYAEVLRSVLALPPESLEKKGHEAREWILTNKNCIKQTSRIIELINKNDSDDKP